MLLETSKQTKPSRKKSETDTLYNIRSRIVSMSKLAKSAHVGSALSCVEILYSLFDAQKRNSPSVDKIILSKGHAAMALYAVAESFGQISSEELDLYLQDGSKLWGHPSKKGSAGVDWTTGSLGHGLAAGSGLAYRRQYLPKAEERPGLVTVVISDGECNEGSTWEAAMFANHHRLEKLVAVVDYNKIQSFGTVEEVMKLEPLVDKWKSFGWSVVEGDGHDLTFLRGSLRAKRTGPLCVIAHTVKGKGIPSIENTLRSHYQPITEYQHLEFMEAKRAK